VTRSPATLATVVATAIAAAATFAACRTHHNPGTCRSDIDCGGALRCNLDTNDCESPDGATGDGAVDAVAGADAADAGPPCSIDDDCPAGAPACSSSTHTCGPCATDPQCASKDPAHPHCAAGACVECNVHQDCTLDPTKPACVASACVPCTSDKQCQDKLGADPGVCMFHQDGRCATSDEAIYVQNDTTVCAASSSATAGTTVMPFCFSQDGIDAVTAGKRLVVLRGPAPLTYWSAAPTGDQITIVGQQSAAVAPGAFIGIHVTAGDVYVRGLTVQNGASKGIAADSGAVLRLDRVIVKNNAGGGLLVQGAGFDVASSVFDGNGPASVAASSFGGVYLGAAVAGLPSRFWYNTLVSNRSVGLVCADQTQTAWSLLLDGNIAGDSLNCILSSSKVTVDGSPAFDANRPYHLTPGSPCVDAGDPTSFPGDDLDGDVRPAPVAGRSDCGADELVP
jgi:hypothetical protein